MNPVRMTRRIAEHVTQIGLEMRIVGTERKLVRIGEYAWQDGQIVVKELAKYEASSDRWIFPESFSVKASRKIADAVPEGYRHLAKLGNLITC